MTDSQWLIYGANGYTGALVAEEAVRRGHRPVLAGRSADDIHPLADRLGCEARVFGLDDPASIVRGLHDVSLVFHAAGPFALTARSMLDACLIAGVHYLDITGEIPVFEHTFSKDEAARQRGILAASGMGFDTIASDCLIAHVAAQLPDADSLDVGIRAIGHASGGTTKSMLELIGGGGLVRRDGNLVRYRLGKGARTIPFASGPRPAAPIPWGDLSTAYRTTGIPNITTYFVFGRSLLPLLTFAPLAVPLIRLKPLRRLLQSIVGLTVSGPDAHIRRTRHAQLWARVTAPAGRSVQGWLETGEAYQFTVLAGVQAVERVLADPPVGALSPAQVLGADFVLDVPGATRTDALTPG